VACDFAVAGGRPVDVAEPFVFIFIGCSVALRRAVARHGRHPFLTVVRAQDSGTAATQGVTLHSHGGELRSACLGSWVCSGGCRSLPLPCPAYTDRFQRSRAEHGRRDAEGVVCDCWRPASWAMLVCTTLGQSLPVRAGPGKQLEPSADQPKEDEEQKETRGDFHAL
jgi:hypothetical protein